MPKKPPKKPPSQDIKSVQFDLFNTFLANDETTVSNSVEIWDSIPKYFFTPHQMSKLRNDDGSAKPYKWAYKYKGKECTVTVQPAFIEQTDGSFKAFFPSTTEELVEEALKKILTDQQYGIHDPDKSETWVRFSLKMIYRELMARGRTRSLDEIKQAIRVMSRAIIVLSVDGKPFWDGAILQDLCTVSREEYEEDRTSLHVARLPLFVSQAINLLQYRQFNYDRYMSCNEQLARWIYRKMIDHYIQAALGNSYHLLYSTIEGSALLQQTRPTDNRKKITSALDELKNKGVIMDYDEEIRRDGRKVTDVLYTLYPSAHFTTEQKAANKRLSDHNAQAKRARIKTI